MKPVDVRVHRGDVTRMLLWTPALAGGIWLVQALPGFLRSLTQANRGRRVPARQFAQQQALAGLCRAIMGNSKQNVTRILGRPRVAGAVPMGDTPLARAFWDADAWYYLLDARQRCGLAIQFAGGRATKVDYLTPVANGRRSINRSRRPGWQSRP
jgi:outer membrane protein assembly factor BamE (lipoprotein component of BamABCDE complex)